MPTVRERLHYLQEMQRSSSTSDVLNRDNGLIMQINTPSGTELPVLIYLQKNKANAFQEIAITAPKSIRVLREDMTKSLDEPFSKTKMNDDTYGTITLTLDKPKAYFIQEYKLEVGAKVEHQFGFTLSVPGDINDARVEIVPRELLLTGVAIALASKPTHRRGNISSN